MWLIGTAALTAIFGHGAAAHPRLAILAALAIVVVVVMFSNFVVGLCVFTVVSFLDVLPQFAGGLPTTKAVGLVLVGSWFVKKVSDQAQREERTGLLAQRPLLAGALLLFLAWMALSMVWAERVSPVQTSIFRFALNFALFPILFAALHTRRHVTALYVLFVAGALTAAAWGIATHSIGPADRLGGAGLGPNQLGTVLAVATVLAGALSANRAWPPYARAVMVAAAGACMVCSGRFPEKLWLASRSHWSLHRL
jgi:hypothetical protein